MAILRGGFAGHRDQGRGGRSIGAVGSAPHRWWLRSPGVVDGAPLGGDRPSPWRWARALFCATSSPPTCTPRRSAPPSWRRAAVPAFRDWGLGQVFTAIPTPSPSTPARLPPLPRPPFWSAFNLHYTLHWLLAGWGMGCLGLRLGLAGALLAAITWAGSGWMLSALTFYNLLTVAAWWPWVLCGGVMGEGDRPRWAWPAAWRCSAGSVTALLGLLPLLLLCVEERAFGRGAAVASAIRHRLAGGPAAGGLIAGDGEVTFRSPHGLFHRPGT